MLGQKIIKYLRQEHPEVSILGVSKGKNRLNKINGFDYFDIDIANKVAVQSIIENEKPDVVINCAAITNVDVCEAEKELCWKVNVGAVEFIAEVCEKNSIHLIHLSTDFIFDGKKGPYKEDALANPLSYYGESKAASETIVKQLNCPWSIVRTVLVYGVGEELARSNIVLWAIGALEKGDVLNVVNDQKRTPTLAEDLAEACVRIALGKKLGVYNVSGSDFMSIDEMVQRIADFFKFENVKINRISSQTLNQKAKRPPITGFVLDKAIQDFSYQPRRFEEGLLIVKNQLNEG